MHFRQKLTFMAFGSILTLAGYLLATIASDVTAQPEKDKTTVFDEIVCRKLKIVGENGKAHVEIGVGPKGGDLRINSIDGGTAAVISINDDKNGFISVCSGTDSEPRIGLTTGEYGGQMTIFGNGNKGPLLRFLFRSNENGGEMRIFGNKLFDEGDRERFIFQSTKNGAKLTMSNNTRNDACIGLLVTDSGEGFIGVWDGNEFKLLD